MGSGRCVDNSCVVDGHECAGHGICMTDLGDYMCLCQPNFNTILKCAGCDSGYKGAMCD